MRRLAGPRRDTVKASKGGAKGLPRAIPGEGSGRGTGNTSPDITPDPDGQDDARQIELGTVPSSPAAIALCQAVCELLDFRLPTRQASTNTRAAVGAIVGGVLRAWLKDNQPAFRSRHAESFSGEAVGHRAYCRAEDALLSAGMLRRKDVKPVPAGLSGVSGGVTRRAARVSPTAGLLALATARGVTGETVATDWRVEIMTTAPQISQRVLVDIRPLAPRPHSRPPAAPAILRPMRWKPQDVDALVADVEAVNGAMDGATFTGCRPPRFFRAFRGDLLLGGRFYCPGGSGNPQTMRQGDRRAIRINGEDTAELDMQASQLVILAAWAGFAMPEGDPYGLEGVRRDAVKAYIVQTLGNGRTPRTWGRRTPPDIREAVRLTDVRDALTARFPFLRDPVSTGVRRAAGLDELDHLAPPAHLLTHRLQNIEAQAVSLAMRTLRQLSVPCIPVHDSLIVPASSAEAARGALADACQDTFGAVPLIRRKD